MDYLSRQFARDVCGESDKYWHVSMCMHVWLYNFHKIFSEILLTCKQGEIADELLFAQFGFVLFLNDLSLGFPLKIKIKSKEREKESDRSFPQGMSMGWGGGGGRGCKWAGTQKK